MSTYWGIFWIIILLGILIFKKWVDSQPDLTPEEVAKIIDSFVEGTDGPYDWDDYIHIPSRIPELEQIRKECEAIAKRFPSQIKTEWCSAEGLTELKLLANKARQLSKQPPIRGPT